MIPRLRPILGKEEIVAALAGRGSVDEFESAFARLVGQAEAIAFPYGRTALLILFDALGISGREVILPAYTCVVVAHAVVLSGNTPVFVDSEAGGFNMDLDKAAAAITPQTGAILATSIHGYPVNLDKLEAIMAAHPHVAVIQDCAHSFLANWNGRPVHKAGVAAVFGLNVSKLMTSIFGGMVTTDDPDLTLRLRAARERQMRSSHTRSLTRALYLCAAAAALSPPLYGAVQLLIRLGFVDRFVRYYDESAIDMPDDYLVQIGNAEAGVGVVQCGRYPEIVRRRRETATYYDQALRPTFGEALPPLVEGATYSHYVMRINDPEGLAKHALARGVELGRVIDYCIPDMPAYLDFGRTQGPFEETRKLNRTIVNVPIWVNGAEARRVADILGSIGDTTR